jgi:hypothetical protein
MPLNITQSQRNFWKKYAQKNIRSGQSSNIVPGRIYFFNYDSKMYEEGRLAYYDQFPIILVLAVDSKYILGLAFHYLPRLTREYFIKKIILSNFKALSKGLPANVPYKDVKDASNLWYREGMAIVRKYIRNRVKSKVVELNWREWYNAMSTESAKWIDITAAEAYMDTKYRLQMIHGRGARIRPPKRQSILQKQIAAQRSKVKKEKEAIRNKFKKKSMRSYK